jgi:hypothetical protein
MRIHPEYLDGTAVRRLRALLFFAPETLFYKAVYLLLGYVDSQPALRRHDNIVASFVSRVRPRGSRMKTILDCFILDEVLVFRLVMMLGRRQRFSSAPIQALARAVFSAPRDNTLLSLLSAVQDSYNDVPDGFIDAIKTPVDGGFGLFLIKTTGLFSTDVCAVIQDMLIDDNRDGRGHPIAGLAGIPLIKNIMERDDIFYPVISIKQVEEIFLSSSLYFRSGRRSAFYPYRSFIKLDDSQKKILEDQNRKLLKILKDTYKIIFQANKIKRNNIGRDDSVRLDDLLDNADKVKIYIMNEMSGRDKLLSFDGDRVVYSEIFFSGVVDFLTAVAKKILDLVSKKKPRQEAIDTIRGYIISFRKSGAGDIMEQTTTSLEAREPDMFTRC